MDPSIVEKTNNINLFRIIRNFSQRGNIIPYDDQHRLVMACDNTGPQNAFKWAIGDLNGEDMQFNHIYSLSSDVAHYTSLANICVTPAFLAKVTDTSSEVLELLKYRIWDIYGYCPDLTNKPQKPTGYENLVWRKFAEPEYNINSMADHFRRVMNTKPKNRTTVACKNIGWYFSDFKPDVRIG